MMKNKRSFFALILLSVFTVGLLSACSFGSSKPEMSEDSLNLSVGSSANLSVSGGSSPYTWTSSDANIATVEGGTVTAKAPGSAVIKAEDDKGKTCSCNVSVADKEITALALDQQTASVDAGKTIQLNATYTPTDASNTNLTWASSDPSVAVVNSSGYVTGVKGGVANITCKSQNGVEASCTVKVKGSSDSNQNNNNNQNNNQNNNNQNNNNNNNNGSNNNANGYSSSSSDFIFPDSSVRQLSRSEINSVLSSRTGASVSGSYAQDAINEIYARNGYCFQTPSIRSYYESKPWYHADPSFTTGDFNSVEKYNINLLMEYT